MKKTVFTFGIIAGMMIYGTIRLYNNQDFQSSAILGYTTMVIAFSLIFVGIKRFRDKYNQGAISFGKAFTIGLYITLIASTIYVATWLIEYYVFFPDFAEQYKTCVMNDARKSGATPAELDARLAEMAEFQELYKNPLFVILISYIEIFPIGLVISLLSALLLKRKIKPDAPLLAS